MIMGWLFRTEIRKGFSASKVVHIFTKGVRIFKTKMDKTVDANETRGDVGWIKNMIHSKQMV